MFFFFRSSEVFIWSAIWIWSIHLPSFVNILQCSGQPWEGSLVPLGFQQFCWEIWTEGKQTWGNIMMHSANLRKYKQIISFMCFIASKFQDLKSDGSTFISEIQFTPSTGENIGNISCYASNTIGQQAKPCVFTIIPLFPPPSPTNCLVRNITHSQFSVSKINMLWQNKAFVSICCIYFNCMYLGFIRILETLNLIL